MHMTLAPRFARAALAGALALLSACALNGNRPGVPIDPDRITADEIAASGEANAYAVVQKLRPAWLRQRVDHQTTGVTLQTLVIHNGSRYGFLGSLRDLPAEMIGSMRYMVGSEAQSQLLGTDRDIGAVIEVFSHGVEARRAAGGGGQLEMKLSASAVVFPLGFAHRQQGAGVRSDMEDAGWTLAQRDDGPSVAGMLALDVGPVGPVSVGILAVRPGGTEMEHYTRLTSHVRFWHSSTTLAAVVAVRRGPVRVGVGPALQYSWVDYGFGECGCAGPGANHEVLRGAVAEGVAELRLPGPFTGELRVQRYFLPETSIPTLDGDDMYQVSRPGWFVGLGGGVRVGR